MASRRNPPQQRVFLLRCWEERSEDPRLAPQWRFRLEESRTGKLYGFADLEALMTFLKEHVLNDTDSPDQTVA